MKLQTKQRIKGLYEKYKTEIIVTGVVIVGAILAISFKPKIKEVEVFPNWAIKWRTKCDADNLLYENGLPIYADDSETTIYSDAFANDIVKQQFIESGYKVIERT